MIKILLIFTIISTSYAEEIWIWQKSHHFHTCENSKYCLDTNNGYNQDHPSIAHVNDKNQFVFLFKNSYNMASISIGKKYSWKINDLIEPNIKLGIVYGYKDIMKYNYHGISPLGMVGLDLNITNSHTMAFNVVPGTVISVGYVYKY